MVISRATHTIIYKHTTCNTEKLGVNVSMWTTIYPLLKLMLLKIYSKIDRMGYTGILCIHKIVIHRLRVYAEYSLHQFSGRCRGAASTHHPSIHRIVGYKNWRIYILCIGKMYVDLYSLPTCKQQNVRL